jgi:hypothetical protein
MIRRRPLVVSVLQTPAPASLNFSPRSAHIGPAHKSSGKGRRHG